jgi:hypothetical protein
MTATQTQNWTQTSRRTADNGDVFTVYRDQANRGHVVTHFSARRGGCLYLGEVIVRDDNAGPASFAFSTTSAPWSEESGPAAAAAYFERHQDKLAVH